MFAYELYKRLHRKRNLIVLLFMLTIMLWDVYLVFKDSYINPAHIYPGTPMSLVYKWTYIPPDAAFLSGLSHGHIPQTIIIWLMPIYLLLLGAGDHCAEHASHMDDMTKMRSSHKTYYAKLLAQFLYITITFIILATINYLVCLVVFRHGQYASNMYKDNLPLLLSNRKPYISYITFIILFGLLSACYATAITALSTLIPFRLIVWIISFYFWYSQLSYLPDLYQPYTEVTFAMRLHDLVLYIIPLLIVIIISVIVNKVRR